MLKQSSHCPVNNLNFDFLWRVWLLDKNYEWKNNGNNLVYVPVSVSGLDLLLKYSKILPPSVRLWLGSIIEAHGGEVKSECDGGKN